LSEEQKINSWVEKEHKKAKVKKVKVTPAWGKKDTPVEDSLLKLGREVQNSKTSTVIANGQEALLYTVTGGADELVAIYRKACRRPAVVFKQEIEHRLDKKDAELEKAWKRLKKQFQEEGKKSKAKADNISQKIIGLDIAQKIYERERRRNHLAFETAWAQYEEFFARVEKLMKETGEPDKVVVALMGDGNV